MQPFRSSIFWVKTTSLCLCLTILLCLWVAPAVFAVENEGFQDGEPLSREGSTYKAFTWDNDVTICTGPVSGGISIDYDTSGNVYAVRCTTGGDFRIYKSTDGGKHWSDIATVVAPLGSSYPVILTGSTGNKLYLLYLSSSQNGDIWMARFTQSGVFEGSYEVKVDTDTITYFSACVDYENGNHLMVAYQRERPGDTTPNLYTITSTDYGETWGDEQSLGDGAHPDIAYGRNGYVYLVYEHTWQEDYEIMFYKSRDYCSPSGWVARLLLMIHTMISTLRWQRFIPCLIAYLTFG